MNKAEIDRITEILSGEDDPEIKYEKMQELYKERFGKDYEWRGFTSVYEQIDVILECLENNEPQEVIPDGEIRIY